MVKTIQMKKWSGPLGENYTKRCFRTMEADNMSALKFYGQTRIEMYQEFLSHMDKNSIILEVGCNIGNKLAILKQMGFRNLYGVELQESAIKLGKKVWFDIVFIQGSIFDLPFQDCIFDMVFTSGLLIHIAPADLAGALQSVCRCSKKFIWGFEYYNDKLIEIDYRGEAEMLWKGDYAIEYLKACPNLKIIKEKKFPYLENTNVDAMFLIEKQ